MLLVLDLDLTLVYATTNNNISSSYDFTIKLNENEIYYIHLRPYLNDFLRYCEKHFSIAFWSAGDQDYVEAIVKQIQSRYLTKEPVFVWNYNHCTKSWRSNGDYEVIKPLKKVWRRYKNFTIANTLVIDDTCITYRKNYGNAVAVRKFFGESSDIHLLEIMSVLMEYVKQFQQNPNVRHHHINLDDDDY